MNAKVNITNRAGASFPVRRMNFDFNDVPEYWMNGSAGLTHFMTALSALFPDGEKFLSIRFVQYATILQSKTTIHCKKKSAPLLVKKPCILKSMLALMPRHKNMVTMWQALSKEQEKSFRPAVKFCKTGQTVWYDTRNG